jgi:hypothetical protein
MRATNASARAEDKVEVGLSCFIQKSSRALKRKVLVRLLKKVLRARCVVSFIHRNQHPATRSC